MTENTTVTVKLATVLARHTGDNKIIDCKLAGNHDLNDALDVLDKSYPGIKPLVCEDGKSITDSINIYVNGDNVRYLKGLETPLKQDDIVNIIPAAAAG